MNPIEIPQLVDEPPHVLFWQSDEVAPIGIGLVFGMFTGYAAVMTLGGFCWQGGIGNTGMTILMASWPT